VSAPRKRIVIHRPGGYEVLRIDHTPIEDPGPGQVQVVVKACGINFADISVRLGLYKAAQGLYPLCPGLEFAGIVRAVGKDIVGFAEGDGVFGATRFGGYASVVNCPPEHIWKLPPHWTFSRGATFPVAYLTAAHALYQVGHLQPATDLVMVHSAAGGVGTALLHLLKREGNASVGVVGRSEKVHAAKEAGAFWVIDKARDDLWQKAEEISPSGYDLILDAVGPATLRGSYRHLKPGGRLLVYGFASMFSASGRRNYPRLIWRYFRTPRFNPFEMTLSNKTVSGFNLIFLFDKVAIFREIMSDLLAWDRAGHLPVMPVTVYPFEEVAAAHMAMESGKTSGKLVLILDQDAEGSSARAVYPT
jgi:NADPH:quinone reductase-like Zn-dependent oxidoreductase